MTKFTKTKNLYQEINAAVDKAAGELDKVDDDLADAAQARNAIKAVGAEATRFEGLDKETQKFVAKAKLPKDQRLYNEAKCTEMLTLGKNVEALGEKLQGLTSQCNIFTQALQAVEEQKKEEEASKQKAEAVAKAQQAAREAQAAKEAKEAADKAEAERVAKEQALKAAADAKAAAEAEAAKLKAVAAAKAESDAMEIETAATKAAAEAAEQMQIEADAAPKGFALVVKLVSSGGKNQLDIVVPDSGVTIADVKKEIERLQPDCPAGRQILLSKGRVLKDADTLDQSRVVSGQELHVGVKPGGAPAQPTATAASGAGTATTAIPAAQSGPRTKDQVVKDTFDALAALKSAVPYAIFLVAVNTLVRLVSNVLAHPGVAKYSRVRFNNDALQKKLFSKVGGLAALKAIGFVEHDEAGEKFFIMPNEVPATVGQVKAMLDEAIAALSQHNTPTRGTQASP